MVMLSKEERQKILDRLEKLLSHVDTANGERTFNSNEVAIANKKIKEITDEYGISLDELKATNNKRVLMENMSVYLNTDTPKMWARSLSGVVAEFYECRCIRTKGHFHFIGFKLDSEVASEIFKKLYYLIASTSKLQARNAVDFSFGAVISLRSRFEEIRKEREKTNSSCALVVMKKDAVDEEVKKLFPYLKEGKKVTYNMSQDFVKGLQYGKTVEIFKGVGGKSDEIKKDNKQIKTEHERKVFKIKRK